MQSVDLTEMAKEGKLDPTIGRDEGMYMPVLAIPSSKFNEILLLSEIRRTIQSRFLIALLASPSQKFRIVLFHEGWTG
jgi:hypothetical protein